MLITDLLKHLYYLKAFKPITIQIQVRVEQMHKLRSFSLTPFYVVFITHSLCSTSILSANIIGFNFQLTS